jgi:CDP-glucose 4,6-dehydratase
VKDVAQAYMRLAKCLDDERVRGEAFNFSNEKPMTVMEMVKMIQKSMACSHLEIDIQDRAEGEIRSQCLSAAKAHDILKWEPEFDLQSGLHETILWYHDFLGR